MIGIDHNLLAPEDLLLTPVHEMVLVDAVFLPLSGSARLLVVGVP